MKKIALSACLLAFGLATPAFATSAHHADKEAMLQAKVDKKFSEADTDGDGMISKAEAQAAHDKKFSEEDTNKDGMVSKEEKTAYMKKEHAAHHAKHKAAKH